MVFDAGLLIKRLEPKIVFFTLITTLSTFLILSKFLPFQLAAILSATDPATIMGLIGALGKIGLLIETEAILNDPIAFILLQTHQLSPKLFIIMFFSLILGILIAKIVQQIDYEIKEEKHLSLGFAFFTYWFAEILGLSGLVSVLALASNLDFKRIRKKVAGTFNSIAFLLQDTVIFLSGYFLSFNLHLIYKAFLLSLFLLFLVRPIVVLLAYPLVEGNFNWLLLFVAPRGVSNLVATMAYYSRELSLMVWLMVFTNLISLTLILVNDYYRAVKEKIFKWRRLISLSPTT